MSATKEVSFIQFLKQIKVLDPGFSAPSSESSIAPEVLSEHLSLPTALLDEYKTIWESLPQTNLLSVNLDCVTILDESRATAFKAVVFDEKEESYHIAASDPSNERMQQYFDATLAKPVELFLASDSKIDGIISEIYRKTDAIKALAESLSSGAHYAGNRTDVSNLCALILEDGYQYGATDIHFELNNQSFIYYYRIGHETSRKMPLPYNVAKILQQYIIIAANGDIAEKKAPQDLSFTYENIAKNIEIEIRVSVIYSANGFSTVLRLLKGEANYFELDSLLYDQQTHQVIKQFLDMKSGMCLITGPTASGKTTLLYSMLAVLGARGKKILTIEDPVEVRYPFLIQTEVAPDAGADFSDIIRSSLRQNPDVLMIGEIRDGQTGEMAVRSALTGTLALSTLHTENAIKTIARLFDFEIEPFLLASSIKLILAVRLLRTICPYCKTSKTLDSTTKKRLNAYFDDGTICFDEYYYGAGCSLCDQQGVKGQRLISEYIPINEKIKNLMIEADAAKLTAHLEQVIAGKTLKDAAITLFKDGIIPIEELLGVATTL